MLKIKKVFVHVHGVVRFERFYAGTAQELGGRWWSSCRVYREPFPSSPHITPLPAHLLRRIKLQ